MVSSKTCIPCSGCACPCKRACLCHWRLRYTDRAVPHAQLEHQLHDAQPALDAAVHTVGCCRLLRVCGGGELYCTQCPYPTRPASYTQMLKVQNQDQDYGSRLRHSHTNVLTSIMPELAFQHILTISSSTYSPYLPAPYLPCPSSAYGFTCSTQLAVHTMLPTSTTIIPPTFPLAPLTTFQHAPPSAQTYLQHFPLHLQQPSSMRSHVTKHTSCANKTLPPNTPPSKYTRFQYTPSQNTLSKYTSLQIYSLPIHSLPPGVGMIWSRV